MTLYYNFHPSNTNPAGDPYPVKDVTISCPHCHTIIGHFDGDRLKIGGVSLESVSGNCITCGGYIYWSKFGGQA